jgi:hypothetical protein
MDGIIPPSRQEMFDRAVHGLASQGWVPCTNGSGNCLYFDPPSGRRCAWGWVDTGLDGTIDTTVRDLSRHGVGVAAVLVEEDLEFAVALQGIHDGLRWNTAGAHRRLRYDMRLFGESHGLTWPIDVPIDDSI